MKHSENATSKKQTDTLSESQSPVSDGTYERFMDSLLSKQGIIYSNEILKVHPVSHLVKYKNEGYVDEPVIPQLIQIGHNKYPIKNVIAVNDDEEYLRGRVYEFDTAIEFSIAGKKYAYLSGRNNCNGAGCLEEFHFICDYQRKRLHVFKMYAVPNIRTQYFGDFDADGNLDFMTVECECMKPYAYCDTTETVLFTPYTLDGRGYFVATSNDRKRNNVLIGQFDSGYYAPNNFRLIGNYWR